MGVAIRAVMGLAVLAFVLGCQAPPQPAPKPAEPAKPAPAAEKPAAAQPAKPAEKPAAAQPAKPAPQPAAPAKERKKIVVNTAGTSLLYTSLYYTYYSGLFQEEGFDAELIEPAGAPLAAQAVLSGSTFLGMTVLNAHITAIEKNQPLVAIAAGVNQNANMLIIGKDWAEKNKLTAQTPLADKIKALKGARIAIVGPRSAVDDLARYLLIVYGGLNPDRDVQLVPLGASPNFPPALEKKQIDAFVGASPASEIAVLRFGAFQAVNLNAGEVPDLRGQLFMVYIVHRDSLDKRRADVEAALRAVGRAQKAIAEKPDEVKRLIREKKFANIEPDIFDLAWKNNLPGFARSPVIDEAGYKSNFTQLAKARNEPIQEIPFAKAVDNTVAEKVAKELGLTR
ncbi:MAG: ABC transporter substrate-binding protein [Chloroflexi bacterium]|nr:ABC transporter substrate-binding protein [Chloroflexota bacterium]